MPAPALSNAFVRAQRHIVPGPRRIARGAHLDAKDPKVQVGDGREGSPSQIDVVRLGCASQTSVDDANKDTFRRAVAHYMSLSTIDDIEGGPNTRSRNLKH
jgi:hypothetical protein